MTGDGRQLHANASENPDLYCAGRGGGELADACRAISVALVTWPLKPLTDGHYLGETDIVARPGALMPAPRWSRSIVTGGRDGSDAMKVGVTDRSRLTESALSHDPTRGAGWR